MAATPNWAEMVQKVRCSKMTSCSRAPIARGEHHQRARYQYSENWTGANPRLLSPENSPHSLVNLKTTPVRRTPNARGQLHQQGSKRVGITTVIPLHLLFRLLGQVQYSRNGWALLWDARASASDQTGEVTRLLRLLILPDKRPRTHRAKAVISV